MSMIEAFIRNLNQVHIVLLELIEENWFSTKNENRDIVLCAIINEKIRRYEEEY